VVINVPAYHLHEVSDQNLGKGQSIIPAIRRSGDQVQLAAGATSCFSHSGHQKIETGVVYRTLLFCLFFLFLFLPGKRACSAQTLPIACAEEARIRKKGCWLGAGCVFRCEEYKKYLSAKSIRSKKYFSDTDRVVHLLPVMRNGRYTYGRPAARKQTSNIKNYVVAAAGTVAKPQKEADRILGRATCG